MVTSFSSTSYDEHSPSSDRSGCAGRSIYSSSDSSVCSATELTMPQLGTRVPTADDNGCPRSFSPLEFSRAESRRLSPLATSWTSDILPPSTLQSCRRDVGSIAGETLGSAPQIAGALQQPRLVDSPLVYTESSQLRIDHPANSTKLVRLSLWAEGMHSYTIPLHQSTQLSTSAVALCIKLHLPPIDSPSTPGLHGFQGSITCTAQPSASFRCSTSVLVRNQCVSQEIGLCSLVTVEHTGQSLLGTSTLLLPDSALSRSRWLDSTVPTCIVQKLFVDGEVTAVICYDLDRGLCENMPSCR